MRRWNSAWPRLIAGWAATLTVGLMLAACAAPPTAPPADLFDDAAFGPPQATAGAADIFAVSAAMDHYLRTEIAPRARNGNPRVALFDALYNKGQLRLEYDAEMTRNAAEAFDARAGNCLSLVIMTAALAKEMGLGVEYNHVIGEDNWSRNGDLYFVSGHVNLTLGKRLDETQVSYQHNARMTIDFIRPPNDAVQRSRPLNEETIVAMYLNNRSAEALARQQLPQAYWLARAAILQDPAFGVAYNTLGVIYRRHGDLEAARRSFAHAQDLDPFDTVVMANLALSLELLGRADEARPLRQKLARLEPEPPFHFFKQGQQAMERGDYRAALALFQREVRRDPYYHEFHFWLAQAYAKLGDIEQASAQLRLALDNSSTRGEQNLYAGKLERIRAHRQ